MFLARFSGAAESSNDALASFESDVDHATTTATLTLSNVAAGSLSTGTSGAVTSTFSAGVWTASGAIANVNILLAGITFAPAVVDQNMHRRKSRLVVHFGAVLYPVAQIHVSQS